MKSIKKKAEELYCIPRGDDTEDTVALDLDKAVTFTEGAYYVLDEVESLMKDVSDEFPRFQQGTIIHGRLIKLLEQLKKLRYEMQGLYSGLLLQNI